MSASVVTSSVSPVFMLIHKQALDFGSLVTALLHRLSFSITFMDKCVNVRNDLNPSTSFISKALSFSFQFPVLTAAHRHCSSDQLLLVNGNSLT